MLTVSNSFDKVRRATLRVSFRVTLEDIADLYVCNVSPYDPNEWPAVIAKAQQLKPPKIIEIVKAELRNSGDEICQYQIGDNSLQDLSTKIQAIFKPKFPEFDK